MKNKKGALLLAGLAAYAYYEYSKLSPEQKKDLGGTLREKGKRLIDSLPESVKQLINGSILSEKKDNANTSFKPAY